MTLAELDAAVVRMRQRYPSWREGQAYFNALARLEPECAEAVRGMSVDPFHDDRRLPELRRFVAEWIGDSDA